jgi:parallel beta-helix repeat protein
MIGAFETTMLVILQVVLLSFLPSSESIFVFTPTYAQVTKCVNYDIYTNTISLSCNANLSQIDQAVNDPTVLQRDVNGVWILNAIIEVNPHAKLTINHTDTTWLKITNKILKEDEPNFISISGLANIDGVKITSWNPFSNDVIRQNVNGSVPRPYLTVNRGIVNISNSELSFLGFGEDSSKSGLSYQHGGNGSQIIRNTIHDMWDAFHSDSAGFITIQNNKYYNNLRNGIYIFDTSNTKVYDNLVKSTHVGVQIAHNSLGNYVYNNTLTNNTFGLYVADNNPKNNLFENNNLNNVTYPIKLDGLNNIGRNNTIYNNS